MDHKMRLLVPALMLAMAAAGGSAVAISARSGPLRAAAAKPACSPLTPQQKCDPETGEISTATPTTTRANTATLITQAPTTNCGRTFFTSTERQTLMSHFGQLTCFRLDATGQWVVFANGMTVVKSGFPVPAAPGGSMIAVLNCSRTSTPCLNANTPHSFSSFKVFYPPEPGSGRSNLEAVAAGGIVTVYNGDCSNFLFDLETLTWYPGTSATAQALAAGRAPAAVNVPASVTGTIAQSVPAPRGTGDCPTYSS